MTTKLPRAKQSPVLFFVDNYIKELDTYVVSEINKIQINWFALEEIFGTDLALEVFENVHGTLTFFSCGDFIVAMELNYTEDRGLMLFIGSPVETLENVFEHLDVDLGTKLHETLNMKNLKLEKNNLNKSIHFSTNSLMKIVR